MKVSIGGTEYTKIRNLEFSPECDITCSSLPSNQFRVDIFTNDTIAINAPAILKDDSGQVWASYKVTDVQWVVAGIVKVKAEDGLSILDKSDMDMTIYGTQGTVDDGDTGDTGDTGGGGGTGDFSDGGGTGDFSDGGNDFSDGNVGDSGDTGDNPFSDGTGDDNPFDDGDTEGDGGGSSDPGGGSHPDLPNYGKTATVAAIAEILEPLNGNYTIDPDVLGNESYVRGAAPKQSRRERLLWILLSIGAYATTGLDGKLEIRKLSKTPALIPIDQTFWKPRVEYKRIVTKIRVVSHEYEAKLPEVGEDYLSGEDFSDGGTGADWWTFSGDSPTYVHHKRRYKATNPDISSGYDDNVVDLEDVTVVTEENATDVLQRLEEIHFDRMEVDADIINNHKYFPGDYVLLYLDRMNIVSGYIKSCQFKFGVQARSRIRLTGCKFVAGDGTIGGGNTPGGNIKGGVKIKYIWEGTGTLLEEVQIFPEEWIFTYTPQWLDKRLNDHRYIFRPLIGKFQGEVKEQAQEFEIPCTPALDLYDGVLHVINVDNLTHNTELDALHIDDSEGDAFGPGEEWEIEPLEQAEETDDDPFNEGG